MSQSILSLEKLPNELLIDVFKYFHAGELLRTFFNLNHRFNQLIKSMNYLSLVITKENHDQIEILSPYIYTLTIKDCLNVNLRQFGNLQRLILTDEYLVQFKNLRYEWTGTPMLRVLKLGQIPVFIFRSILSACPNLSYLDFEINIRNESPTKIEPHLNLKHLVLRTSYNVWRNDQNLPIFKDLFACIPNLENLSIHRKDNITIISKAFTKYDWFSSMLRFYFPLLQRFYCYVHVFQLRTTRIEIGTRLRNILKEIIEHFQYVHQKRYRTRLIID